MDTEKIETLKQSITGTVAVFGDETYTKASKMLFKNLKPSVVVRPESSQDVAAVIRFVKENDMPFAIRSGGHGSTASRLQDDILLIDMSGMAEIRVLDADAGTVQVGAGALWHEVASALEPYQLGISSGDTRTVGVGGLATGGGLGWMMRMCGPVVDNMLSAEVVTANGDILQTSEQEHADLFWAVRGGGSNFGVVTTCTFKAHHVPGIFSAMISYPIDEVAKVLRGWRDAMRQAPAELTTMLLTVPAMGDAPAAILIRGCFAGTDATAAEHAFAPLLELDELTHHEVKPMPYKDILENGMPFKNIRVIVHDAFIKELTDDAIATIATLFEHGSPMLQLRHLSGAMNERPADATAFSHRDSEVLLVNPTFVAPDASEQEIEKALEPWRAIKPLSQGCYLNLITEDTGKEIAEAFPPLTLERLRHIKAQYDPDNIFRANYNITPA